MLKRIIITLAIVSVLLAFTIGEASAVDVIVVSLLGGIFTDTGR